MEVESKHKKNSPDLFFFIRTLHTEDLLEPPPDHMSLPSRARPRVETLGPTLCSVSLSALFRSGLSVYLPPLSCGFLSSFYT
ncbi:unnamed protein product [Cuscuta campestris]|uniref:Uncharacterized protein n=1 Tax=Cuscuta campestris TaxID=132261 RepID=A0A484MSZ7_9ASTE|nr:unnamed protein product [Cuscuta campestris]